MKINVKALFNVAGIRCVENGEGGATTEARVAFVTGPAVAAARGLAEGAPEFKPGEGDPEVTYGSVVAVSRDQAGSSSGKVIAPGEDSGLRIEVGGSLIGLTGSAMLELREKIVGEVRKGEKLTRDQGRALEGVTAIFEMVTSAPDTERFPMPMIAQSYQAMLIDAFGVFELPVAPDGFVRKSRADLLRARIGLLEPMHLDALTMAVPLRSLLSSAGIEIADSGIATGIEAPAMKRITEEAIRRAVMADTIMTRELFGAVTATEVARLSAAMIPLQGLEQLRERKAARLLSGTWVDQISARARALTKGDTKGEQFDFAFFAEGGRDMLVISDHIGQSNDVAIIYSWPTAERFPVMDLGKGRVLNISPEEIPEETEVARLSEMLGQIEALGFLDPELEVERTDPDS